MRRLHVALWVVGLSAQAAGGMTAYARSPKSGPKAIEGVVLQVSGGEVITNMGLAGGLPADADLQIYRRLVVKHPVTGKEIEDRFPIGEVRAREVGELLSIIDDFKALKRPPKVGDYVVYEPRHHQPSAAIAPKTVAQAPAAPTVSPDRAALEAVLAQNLGRPLPDRIRTWEAYLQAFPQSPHTEPVGQELAQLRRMLERERERSVAAGPKKPTEPSKLTALFRPPHSVMRGQPVNMVVAVVETKLVEKVRLFVRETGKARYDAVPMARDGDYYFRAAMPQDLMTNSGSAEYYIEAVRTNAALEAIVGRAGKPALVSINDPPVEVEPIVGRSRASVRFEEVNFNTGGDATDRYFQIETQFDYALSGTRLRRFSVGVGMISGEGGPTEEIDADPSATEDISLGYGFAEGELELHTWLGVALRLSAGTHHATDDSASTQAVGIEGRARIGRSEGTRLVLGASALEDLGSRGFAHIHVMVFPRFPIRAGVAVTNLPVKGDYGVRLSTQVGWRPVDWVSVNLIGGWNARTINHHGLAVGSGLAFNW